MTFATQMLLRRSGPELFDTFKNIILLRIFPLQNSWKMLIKLKWQIPGEPLTIQYNWCQGPVPGCGPAVEKHWFRPLLSKRAHHILLFTYYNSEVVSYVKHTHNGWSKYSNDWDLFDFSSTEFWIPHIQFRYGRTHIMISHNKTHRKHGSNNL